MKHNHYALEFKGEVQPTLYFWQQVSQLYAGAGFKNPYPTRMIFNNGQAGNIVGAKTLVEQGYSPAFMQTLWTREKGSEIVVLDHYINADDSALSRWFLHSYDPKHEFSKGISFQEHIDDITMTLTFAGMEPKHFPPFGDGNGNNVIPLDFRRRK